MSKQLHFKTTIVFLNLQRNRSHAERNSKVAPPEELDHLDCQFRQYFRGNRKMALPICQLFRKRFLLFFLTVYLFYSFLIVCFLLLFHSVFLDWTLSFSSPSFLSEHYHLLLLHSFFCNFIIVFRLFFILFVLGMVSIFTIYFH